MKKGLALMVLAVFMLTMVAGCGSKAANKDAAAPEVIKIGVFEPMTGEKAAGGEQTVEGIKLANELYADVLGKKVEVVYTDNKSDKAEAKNAVTRLIQSDKVVAIIGSYGSALSMAAGDTVKQAKVPAVGCSPTNPLVTQGNEYYFRVCFIDPFQGTVMAKYAVNEKKAKTAAIIRNASDDYSVGLCKYFQDAFVKLSGNPNAILTTLDYQNGSQDFTAQLTTIKQKNPDIIFAPGNYGDGALMIKQARGMDIKQPFLGGDTWEAPEFIQIGGAAVEGVAFSTHYSKDAAAVTDMSKTFVEKYKAKYNKEPNAFAALGFDAYMVILDAIKRADSADSVKVRDALATTKDFQGATGIITLDANRDASKSAVILEVNGGAFKYLTTVNP
ncbi:MAG: ABC transporter substrate-binding protein [Methylocystaceae bacterium]